MSSACGLKNVTFYSDSAKTKVFTGNEIIPGPLYPSDPNGTLTVNTKNPGAVSFYVVGTTYGNKQASRQYLLSI